MVKKIKDIFSNRKILMIIGGVLIVLIVLVVAIVMFNDNVNDTIENSDSMKFKNEYEELNGVMSEDGKMYPSVSISKSNIIKYANVSDIVNIFNNKEDAVIYFGSSTCVYCRSAIQVLCDTADDTSLDKIYYLDVNENNNYDEIVTILKDDFITEDREIYVPLVLFVAEGEVVSYNKGTLFSQEDPYKELNDSQKQGLSEIYSYGIRDVLESMKD